jgi:polyphosphate kinase
LRRAADDPDVLAIKMTLYRTGANSEIGRCLVRAAENGKQVAIALELKARFDEQNNIEWARTLERAGAHVFYGSAGLKIHAKAALVVRREQDRIRRYVHLSTGNYNASTSRIYTDLSLFTCEEDLGEDVSELFNSLSGFSKSSNYRQLAVAPDTMADKILSSIAGQVERARRGQPARIFAKLNALVDPKVIHALYRASCAGVRIDLNVRGICCLRPGVAGLSENIRVFSVVGRFLEHSRLLVVGPEGEEEFYLTSADWMPRNLYRRVELLFPVRHEALRQRLRHEVIEPVLHDNCRARDLDAAGSYHRRKPAPAETERDAQHEVLTAVQRHSLRAAPRGAKEH